MKHIVARDVPGFVLMADAKTDALPDYATMMAAYHGGFAVELRRMIDALPIEPGMRVLDMACGDGTYSPLLAERVGTAGEVVAVDINTAYLDLAREQASDAESPIEHVAAPLEKLPFDEGTFDLAWCAQSFYSLPDPLAALRHLRRAVRPGGVVAVLENDTLHHVLLPWPAEMELAIRAAEYQALTDAAGSPQKFYVARRLSRLFRAAGLEGVQVRTYAIDRHAPLGREERTFAAEYLRDLRERVELRLDAVRRQEFVRLADPRSGSYLLDEPDLILTCIDRVVWGNRPSVERHIPNDT